jgi:hypothetical protein
MLELLLLWPLLLLRLLLLGAKIRPVRQTATS